MITHRVLRDTLRSCTASLTPSPAESASTGSSRRFRAEAGLAAGDVEAAWRALVSSPGALRGGREFSARRPSRSGIPAASPRRGQRMDEFGPRCGGRRPSPSGLPELGLVAQVRGRPRDVLDVFLGALGQGRLRSPPHCARP